MKTKKMKLFQSFQKRLIMLVAAAVCREGTVTAYIRAADAEKVAQGAADSSRHERG